MRKYLIILMLLLIISFSSIAAQDNGQGQGQGQDKKKGSTTIAEDDSSGYTINIKDDSFRPPTLVVSIGTTVTWHNQDGKDHTVTSDTGVFDSGIINPGKKFSFTFSASGTYKYHSGTENDIQGEIQVSGPEASAGSSSEGKSSTVATSSQGQTQSQAGIQQGTSLKVPNFPWYSSDVSFTSYEFNYSTFSYFEEYYTSPGTTVISGIISTPIQFDIAQKTPSWIYFGTGQPLPYTQYVATVPSRTNELWVQGATDWSQYVVSPVGTWLQLVSYASDGGSAGFYEIVQTGTTTQKYSTYQFNQGYNAMYFKADQVGRHLLFFIVNNQPSNVVIVDVFAQALQNPISISPYPQGTILPPVSTPISTSGDSQATIVSQGMRGYEVFLDGNYIGTEGTGGDPLDGKFSFRVVGNQNHNVMVYDGQFNYPKTMFFERGGTKIINVEPGTAVYI